MASQMGAQAAPLLRRALKNAPALNHEWIEAVIARDTTILNRILAESFIIISSLGVFTKRRCLELFISGELHLESIRRDGVTMVHNYRDAAVVNGTVTVKGVYRGRDISGQYRYRYTEVYAKWLGSWQAANCQAFHICQAPSLSVTAITTKNPSS